MRYAEVCVNSPIPQRGTFSYSIPAGLNVEVGQAVWVPFGEKVLQGIVLELVQYASVDETRDIINVIETRPLLQPSQILIVRWISQHYLSSLFDAVSLFLPPGFERKAITYIVPLSASHENLTLSHEQEHALNLVESYGKVSLKQIEKSLGKRKSQAVVSQLVRMGLVTREYELENIRIKSKTENYLRLKISPDEAKKEAEKLYRRAPKQARLLEFLAQQNQALPVSDIREIIDCPIALARTLTNKGLINIESVGIKRHPVSYNNISHSSPFVLAAAQKSALEAIQVCLRGENTKQSPSVFLLHGITGSGKTEVYLQALAEVVRAGKRGIVLVPEIALTPQTIERFASRFPDRVALLHSNLSLGERYDEWQSIRDGEFDVVVGSRSAIFAPQPDLGLIILDEEHEWTYKQHDTSPRYHARDMAIKLAEQTGAIVILGSATPDVETYFRAKNGDYQLLELPERVTPDEGSPMPEVEIVDMREELKAGNRSMFSSSLSEAVTKAVSVKEQVILFLNRRGAATFVQCRNCGFVISCRRCGIPLSYHFTGEILLCHQCNYHTKVPRSCPQCSSQRIKYLGAGTQKLEQEAGNTFTGARLLRWDSDITRRNKSAHQEILDEFRSHRADILIGTQMVAKGLDIPRVTLVGVVNADTALNLPDFRAGERTFQLLSQVAGRAGRGRLGGRVIIQTYSPEHYAIMATARHDYLAFYQKEIEYRRQLHNPPFSQLACLVYSHTNNNNCQKETERIKRVLLTERDAIGIAGLDFIGPAPAFINRLRGKYRWQLIIRGYELSSFLSRITFPQGWTIDIDPVSLL